MRRGPRTLGRDRGGQHEFSGGRRPRPDPASGSAGSAGIRSALSPLCPPAAQIPVEASSAAGSRRGGARRRDGRDLEGLQEVQLLLAPLDVDLRHRPQHSPRGVPQVRPGAGRALPGGVGGGHRRGRDRHSRAAQRAPHGGRPGSADTATRPLSRLRAWRLRRQGPDLGSSGGAAAHARARHPASGQREVHLRRRGGDRQPLLRSVHREAPGAPGRRSRAGHRRAEGRERPPDGRVRRPRHPQARADARGGPARRALGELQRPESGVDPGRAVSARP